MEGEGREVGDAGEPSDELPHFGWTGEMRRGSARSERFRRGGECGGWWWF